MLQAESGGTQTHNQDQNELTDDQMLCLDLAVCVCVLVLTVNTQKNVTRDMKGGTGKLKTTTVQSPGPVEEETEG